MRRTYPRGLDIEALHRDTLERVGRLAASPAAREHVTYFIHAETARSLVRRGVEDAVDNSDLRWTVDTPDDMETIRRIFDGAGLAKGFFPYPELLSWVRARPDLGASNAHVRQKILGAI